MTVEFSKDRSNSKLQNAAFLFGYAAAVFALVSTVRLVQNLPEWNAHRALESTVGPQNVDAQRGGLNDQFAHAARIRILPMIDDKTLLPFNMRDLFARTVQMFEIRGVNGTHEPIPFSITAPFPNSTNLYYSVRNGTQQQLVQCNTRQWLRVHITGFVSQQPATLSEIVNDCHVVGASTNPWEAKKTAANQFQTPAGLRDEVASVLQQIAQNDDVPSTETRIPVVLNTYGAGSVATMPFKAEQGYLHLFMDGKLSACEAVSASVSHVRLPNRQIIEDKNGDGFRVREFVTLRLCGS